MSSPLYDLYRQRYELSLSEPDFEKQFKENPTFRNNFQKKLRQSGMTDEAIATHFAGDVPQVKPPEVKKEQPAPVPEPVPRFDTLESIAPEVFPKQTEPAPGPVQNPLEEILVPEPENPDYSNLYSDDLYRLVTFTGLEKKYPKDVISANIDNKQFSRQLTDDLKKTGLVDEDLDKLKNTQQYETRGKYYQLFGVDPKQLNLPEKEIESQYQEGVQFRQQMLPKVSDKNIPFKDLIAISDVTRQQDELLQKDPSAALTYFKQNIMNNGTFSSLYKGMIADRIQTALGKDVAPIDTEIYTPELQKLNDYYAGQNKELDDFRTRNKEGYDQDVAEQVKSLAQASVLVRQQIDNELQKLTSRENPEGGKSWMSSVASIGSRALSSGAVSPIIGEGMDLIRNLIKPDDQKLIKNAIIMRNDVERLIKQYSDPHWYPNRDNTGKQWTSGDVVTGVTQGVKSPLWDVESLTPLIPIIHKQQEGKKLSEVEQVALNTYALLSTAQQQIPTSMGFEVGQSQFGNLEFMATLMAASPLYEGVMATVEKGTAAYMKNLAINKIESQLGKTLMSSTAKWAPKLAGMVVGNMAITPTQPMLWNEFTKNSIGTTVLKPNQLSDKGIYSDLNVDISGTLKANPIAAFAKAFYHATNESFTESAGETFDVIGKAIGSRTGLNKIANTKFGKILFSTSEGSAWRKAARMNSFLGENAEEWLGDLINIPVDGWQNYKDNFTGRNFGVTALSLAPSVFLGSAHSAYRENRIDKQVAQAKENAMTELGQDKFNDFEQRLKTFVTLNQRGKFLEDYMAKNALTPEQQRSLTTYAIATTSVEIAKGSVENKGKGLGIADELNEKDFKLIGKTELTKLVKTELPDQYNALVAKREADFANPDINNREAGKEFQAGFNALLNDPKIADRAREIQSQMNNLILPERTTSQLVANELTVASEKPKKDITGQEAEETKGMSDEQLRSRVRDTFFQLKSVKSDEERNILTAKRDYLVGKIRDLHNQKELERIRLYDQGTQSRTSYTDQDGQTVKVNVSPELMDTNSAIDNFVSKNNELNDRKKQLDAPMPFGLNLKEQENWKKDHQQQVEQYEKEVMENTRQKSLAETRHTEIFGTAPKGKQIAETSTNDLQIGQDVVAEDRISGARVQGKIIQKTDGKAIVEFSPIQQDGVPSHKYQIVYTTGNGRLQNLYEAKEVVHEQRSGITEDFVKLKNGIHKTLFTDPETLKQYNAIRSDDNQRSRWFDSRATAKEERKKAVEEWGEGLITPVYYSKKKNGYVFSMRKGKMEKPQQTARRERYLAWVQQYRQLQDYFKSMYPDELIDYNARVDQEDNSPEKSVDEYIAFKKQYLENLHEQRNDDTDLEQELREIKVIRSAQALAKATGVKLTIVQSDHTGRNRKGWQEGDKYYINLSQATGDTPVHEYAHPVMDVLEQENPNLFNALWDEISATKEGQEIITLVDKLYGDKTDAYRRKEVLVTALGKRGELALKNDLSLFARIVYRLWNAVRNFFAHKINIGGLTPDTTLDELAKMIVTGRIKTGTGNTEINEQRTGNLNVWYSSGENASLSNLAARKFNYEGKDYLSVEHAYQTLKSGKFDDKTYNTYRRAGVKIVGQMGTKTDNGWNLSLMKNLVEASFEQNSDAAKVLTDTDGATFTHNQDNGVWKKEFPRILTEVRNELLNQSKSNSVQSQIIQAVNEKKPVWILYQSSRAKEQGEPATWRKVEDSVLSEDQTQISGMYNGENKTFNIADPERIKGFSLTEPENKEVKPTIVTEKPVYATEAWKETMTATFDAMKSLLTENQAKEPKEREKKSALQQKAVKAGIIAFTKTDYYKLLSTQKKRAYNQILQDQLTKMLKKQKTVLVEDGKSALMEIEAIEGVAATQEDKLRQFMTGVTPQVKEIAAKTGIPEYKIKLSLIDMMKDEFLVHNEEDFKKLESKYTDKDHLLIAKSILETGDFNQYVSLADFFGSLHLEDQVGVTISKGVASMYNQAMSVTQRNMRTDFQKFYLSLDEKASQELQEKIDKYNKWNNDRNLKSEQQGLGIVMDKAYLTATKKLLSVLTGFDLDMIEGYFNNSQVTKGMYYKDGTAVPSGTTLNQLEGKSLYFRNKNGVMQAQRGIPIISSFLSKYSRNLKDPTATLPVLVKNHFNSRINGYSNLDWLITSYTSNEQPGTEGTDVEGNRFQTFALAYQLYDQSLKIKELIDDPALKEYYSRIPMKIQKFNGFHNNDLNKAFSGTKVDGKALWFGMLLHFRNSVAGEYQQFLGQFSDKTAVYTGNVLKIDGKENYERAREINHQINSDIQYIHDLITKDYWQLLGFKAADTQQMADLARDFAVNFTVNLHALIPVMHGNVKAYKNMADMIKRAQVVISPGYKYKINLKDGVREKMRYVVADDYIMRDLQGKGVEQLDGLNFGSEEFMRQAQRSSGTAFAREKDFKDMTSIKAVVTYVNDKGERVLIKSHVSSIGVLANSGMGEIYSQIRDYMRKHDIDVLSFPSSAKKTGEAKKTSLFYNDFQSFEQIVNEINNKREKELKEGKETSESINAKYNKQIQDAETNRFDVTDFVNSLGIESLDTKNENGEIVSNSYVEDRDAERKLIEESGNVFDPTQTGAYDDLKDAISETIDAQKLNDLKTLVAEANKAGKKGIYHAGIDYGQDVATALNEIIQQRLQTQTIQGLEDQNPPSILEVPREAFYIQQDLRHENTAHAQDISSQMYTNMMALEGFDSFIKNLTDANQLQYDFSKEFFAGFKDVEIVKQYLLWNTDPTEDPDFYQMLQSWAINDPGFQKQMVSKLVNTVNRDVLEIRINRQSSTELPDMIGRLKGLRKIFHEGKEYVQLPEIGLNIPGIRYAKEFDTKAEARAWMIENRDDLVDLQDKEGRPQMWQIHQDSWNGKWIVPGEPVVSSRTPAGNLNCHTVARARFRLAGDAAVTMLDIESRRASGSDFDGDSRYNWTFSKVKGGNIVNDTYYGKINQALMALVDEYQNPVNFDKIRDSIDTEAFDGIIKDLESQWNDTATNPSSLQAQGIFRSRNMTGYNMKAIMSNLTTAFSYLKYFGVEGIVKDQFNEIKVILDNILNLSFDNAKDPKIEKLGLGEDTASMFVYELITDPRIDEAKTKEQAHEIAMKIMRELSFKYSPYSKTKDKWINQWVKTSQKVKTDIVSDSESAIRLMTLNNLVEGDNGMKGNPLMKPFLELYSRGRDLEFFNRIKGLRDAIPNKMVDYLLAKGDMSEFTFGNNHFFDQANIINQDTEKPSLRAIYNAMDLAGHIFDLIPGMRFIDHLSALHLSTTNQLKVERKQFKQAQSLRNEQKEVNPLASMIHLPYLLKLRDASFADTRDQLMDYLKKYREVQEQGTEHLNPEFSHNDFLDALIVDEGIRVIAVAPSIRNTKLSEQYEQQLKEGFALLPEELRRKFAYYTLLEHGFSESIRGGGFFALMDTGSRVRFSQYQYASKEQSALNDAIYTRIENEFIQKAEQKVSDRANAKNVTIDDIRKILREEKTSFDFSKVQQASVQKMLDQVQGKSTSYSPEIITGFMDRVGLKSEKELERTLQSIQRSFGNIRYQHSELRNGTETALMDPELFVYLFEHFKKVYPELSVFSNVQEFIAYVEKLTGRTGNFDLSAIGAAFGMAVHINPNTARQDTFFHEVSHVYWDALPETDPVKKRLRLLYGWHSEMTQEQTDAIDELIIEDIGLAGTNRAQLRFEGSRLNLFMDYLKQFWNTVKSVFGLTEGSRRQARMLYSQQIMADRVWQGGINQSEVANSQLIRYQTTGETDRTPGSQTITLPNGKIVTAGHSYFDSQIQYNRSVLNLANAEWKKAQAELSSMAMQPIEQRTPSPGSNIRLDSEGKVYITDAKGNMVATGSLESLLDQEKFINAYIANRNRMGVISAAISNMLDWNESGVLMPTFKLDEADVYLDDFFENPTELFRQLTATIERLQQEYGLSGKLSVNAVVYDDQADHVSSMDLLSTDSQGNTTLVRFVPTYEDCVKDGVKTSAFQGSRGSFLPGSALEGESSSRENEVRVQMIQFATMYNNMHAEKNSPNRVTRMIAVPVKINNGEDQRVESVEMQDEQVYRFGGEEKTLGDRILGDIKSQKSTYRSYNIDSILKAVKNALTVNSRKALEQGINAVKFLQNLTHSTSVRISTHMANITARNGYGKLIHDVLHSGLGWKDYHIGMDQKGTHANTEFTLRFNKKENGQGLLIYGSPGWGKAYAQGYHKDIIDSQILLEQVLTSGHQALLFGKSDKAKQLREYSLRHPVKKEGFAGHIRKEEINYDNIIASYHTNGEEMNLFTFNTSLLIYKLRQQAIQDLIDRGVDLESIRGDINAVRAATSSLTGEEADMIRIDTPYEEFQQSINRQLDAGKHVLSSTLLDEKFDHLINLKYDRVYRLVSDPKDKKENMDRQSKSARQLMHQRTTDSSSYHPIDYTEQEWIQQRFQLEIDRFGEDSKVSFTDGFATDDLFNESVYTHREKITTLRQLWLINRLGITYGQFEAEAKKRQGLTIATYLEEREREHYSKMESKDNEVILSFLNEESEKVLQLKAFKGMGLKENPQNYELSRMISRYKSNFKTAQALWKELGRMMDFIQNSDNITAQTAGQYRLKQEYLLSLFNRIQKLDKINQSGLYEIVAGQISMNYIIRKVSEEAQDLQPDGTRGRAYRIHTIALTKMMKDPDYSWIPNEDRVRWMGVEWSGIIRNIAGTLSPKLKLDRAVDARHPLAQALVLARMDTQQSVMSEITNMTNELNGLYKNLTEEDKKVMTYLYGEKKEVKNSKGEIIYAGDKFKSMFGRKAYLSTNEALELRAQGKLSDAAFQYLQLYRQYQYKYDPQYKEQQDRFNFQAPTFVPDFMAQSDHNQSESEFTRAVLETYGIDVTSKSDRKFRKDLHKAMDTSPEGGMTLENLTDKFGQEYYKYEGLTLSEAKRDLFWPDNVKNEAFNQKGTVRDVLRKRIISFEKLRKHARENSTNRYVENERSLKVRGGFSKGLILRTEQFHNANRMLLNSLISNYYTNAVSPFAFHVEEKYKMKAPNKNPIMSRWATKYITEGIFHHTPEDMKDFHWYHHAFGATVSGISLGLNLHSAIGNLTQGQSQTYILKPTVYKKALSRIDQLSKVIRIMHANHVGMLVEDITFKESDKIWQGAMRTGFWLTEKVEDINQGLAFLGSMTEEELSWYNEDGTPKDSQWKMSPYRIHQIESTVRNINGDYGHNRPLYRSDPWLMELGRFKFGWWQTMINNHFGASYVDPWGEEHISIAETVVRSLQRMILKMKKNFSGESTMEFAAHALGKDGAKVFESQLCDTPEEARMKVLNPLSNNSELSVTIFEVNTDQGVKYYALEPGRTVSVYARMALEMLSNVNKRDYLRKNQEDRENYGKLHREAGLMAAYGVPALACYWIVAGLMAGGGDPDRDGDVEILDALLYSLDRSWVANLFRSEPLAPVEPLKNLSALSDKEYKLIQCYTWLSEYFKGSLKDVAVPYLPSQYQTLTDLTRVPAMGALGSLLTAGWYGVTDPMAKMETTNVRLGYTAQTNKALWYLRQVLPARYVFRQLYEGFDLKPLVNFEAGYLNKDDIETAQVYLKAKSSFTEMFKYVYGVNNHEFDPSSPQDQQLWNAIQEMSAALYYAEGIKERAEKIPMEPLRNLQQTGKQNIDKGKNQMGVSVETTRKWKKQFGID